MSESERWLAPLPASAQSEITKEERGHPLFLTPKLIGCADMAWICQQYDSLGAEDDALAGDAAFRLLKL
jgi:hypothetical protein